MPAPGIPVCSATERAHYPACRAKWPSSASCLPTDRAVIVLVSLSVFISLFFLARNACFPSSCCVYSLGGFVSPSRGLHGPGLPQPGLGGDGRGHPGELEPPQCLPRSSNAAPHPRAAASSRCPGLGDKPWPPSLPYPAPSSPDPPHQAPGSSVHWPQPSHGDTLWRAGPVPGVPACPHHCPGLGSHGQTARGQGSSNLGRCRCCSLSPPSVSTTQLCLGALSLWHPLTSPLSPCFSPCSGLWGCTPIVYRAVAPQIVLTFPSLNLCNLLLRCPPLCPPVPGERWYLRSLWVQ